jgi:hypothetical protein
VLIIASISGFTEAAKNLSDEKLNMLKELFPSAERSGEYMYGAKGVVNLDQLVVLLDATGLTADISPYKACGFFSKLGLEERLKALEADGYLVKQQLLSGSVVQVHVPNFSLLNINSVAVLEDACTSYLQAKLDEGWRILAVCPPMSERRPTYIMGRFDPSM